MMIQLPPELARFVRDPIAAGRYPSEDAVVLDALERLSGHDASHPQPGPGPIGAMRDDADLLEPVTRDIMEGRRSRTLRRSVDE